MDILEFECEKLKILREECLLSLDELSRDIYENVEDIMRLEDGESNNLRLYLKVKHYLTQLK